MTNVYFILMTDKIKIGYTKDIHRRITELKVGAPAPITLLGLVPGGRDEEQNLHKVFHKYKTKYRGEWFQAADEIINYINEHNSMSVHICKDEQGIIRPYMKIRR